MTHEEDRQRRELLAKYRERIDRVREVVKQFDVGGMTEGRALSLIEDIASGEADRIVKVGGKHTPEVET